MYFCWPLRGLVSSIRCSGGTAANTRPASSSGRRYRWNRVSSRRPDVRAVHVGVRHEDHPLVPGRVQVERGARAGPDHLDDRGALGVLEHVGQRRLLHVEDLAADRQQRLELRVAGHLRGAERGVALDDEQLAAVIGRLRQSTSLAGSAEAGQCGLAPLVVPVLAGGDPGLGGRGHLLEHRPGLLLAAPGPAPRRRRAARAATTWATIREAAGVPSTSLVWPSNCGSGSRTAMTAVRPSSTSSLIDRLVAVLQQPGRPQLLVQRPDQRPLETGHVRAALGGGDHVDERPGRRVVAGPPPQRHVDRSAHARRRSGSCAPGHRAPGPSR